MLAGRDHGGLVHPEKVEIPEEIPLEGHSQKYFSKFEKAPLAACTFIFVIFSFSKFVWKLNFA